MTSPTALGADYSSTPQANALAAAFASVQTLLDPVHGQALITSTGAGQVPYLASNSLANALAACVNSASASSTQCSGLFSATTVGGAAPSDTIQATLNLAKNPTQNPGTIYSLSTANPPFMPTLTAAPASYALTVAHPSDVLTYHNNNARTGVQPYETTLTPTTVAAGIFGKKYTYAVDSYQFAQPLYVGGVGMPDGLVHNLVFASTTHATVYAFDADGGGQLWSVSLVPTGERFAAAADYNGCTNPPESGIVGTPVIDRSTQTLYVVTKTVAATGTITPANTYQRLHAISLLDGSERPNSPTLINPTFIPTGSQAAGIVGGVIPFNAQTQNNRSALLLTTNSSGVETVWIAYASHCDIGPYHGIVLGYNATTLGAPTATFNNTPNGNDGGIWMGAGGLAADSAGYIYASAGNGTFDANTGGADYGDAATKLAPPASGSTTITVADYFTPSNQADLQSHDLDLGGNEGILFNDPASGVAPNLYIASDKNGYIYLLNTASMGGYDTGTNGINSLNGDIQDFSAGGGFIYNFAFFNNTLYTSNGIKSYTFDPGTSNTAGHFNTIAAATGPVSGPNAPVVSANGTADAIVWTQGTDGQLHALNPVTLTDYWNSTGQSGMDVPPTFNKFTSPVIANGKLYLSGQGGLAIYAPLP